MTIKNAQARSSLALLIEEKLGYAMIKQPKAAIQSEDRRFASTPNPNQNQFIVRSEHGVLKRALKRNQLQRIAQQRNIESIMGMSLTLCPDVTSRGRPDPDWLEHFIALAEDIANSAMQKLWAKILVGESISPGTFSIKSLQTLKQMTQKEADALQRCASLCGYLEKEDSYLILLGFYKKPSLFDLLRKGAKESLNLAQAGLSFPHILTLMDINLIYRQEIESANLQKGQSMTLAYQGKHLSIEANSNDLVLSYYKLTQTGDELKKLINTPVNKTYRQLLGKALEEEFTLTWES
ncbi:TIGR03899 family protein [Pseudoalteromonas rubra]|uniref:TIGR03899 family protein n=1 Tax=Pseudoalteromonas rubra TaxID=43658 RepID=A0A5S3WT81_9GAMM|nr:TIGR03899 family protein [Pseudoalteromonas rubra]TMP31533.1 TIGR03899 family protein [Pseudoalteromonas rubra]TMP34617.1 TIGR03899 family protein [Pseudoalteromonas rubra]